MNTRRNQLEKISERLGRKRLIWFGTRGDDARPLLALEQFTHCYSQIAPLGPGLVEEERCLEELSRVRVDLNSYNIDADTSPERNELHADLVTACAARSALVAYRPAAFITSSYFPTPSVEYLGMFQERQAAFEHKPWVETELRKAGVPTIPWEYVADDDPRKDRVIAEALRSGPVVLRANRSSGGAGLTLVREESELVAQEPSHVDGFIGYAPYLEPNIPLNVTACVFPGRRVTVHAPSFQLIGIDVCTSRPFGYCGNDFARVADLENAQLAKLEAITRTTGRWLGSLGYLGAFGIDAMVTGGDVILTEINARFQGSSEVGARLSARQELPDIFTDHIAAFLGLDPWEVPPLRDLARNQEKVAQVICYNRGAGPVGVVREDAARSAVAATLLPEVGIDVAPEAMLFKLVKNGPVTETGSALDRDTQSEIAGVCSDVFAARALTG